MSPRILLKKYGSIMLYTAHITSAAVLAPPSLYTVQHGRVTLTGHCTYSRSQKYIIYIIKSCRLNVSFAGLTCAFSERIRLFNSTC